MGRFKADAIFEGGGVKGIGLAGALCAAEEEGYEWGNVAGTSAGAMIASFIAAGYSAEEIKNIIMNIDYKSFNDKTLPSYMPLIGSIISILTMKGIYKGDFAEKWLREKYRAKVVEKFGDIKTGYKDEKYRYKLRVIASDISQKRLLVLPQDIKKYGMDPDYLDIASAVRMSIGIPIFFKPVILNYHTESKNQKSMIVDGGLLSNFPVWLFDEKGVPPWPTFGFRLVEPCYNCIETEMNAIKYVLNIVSTMMEAFDQRYIETSNFERTIAIPTMGVGSTEFSISRERSMSLFNSGYNAAKGFLKKWDFRRYIREYRNK